MELFRHTVESTLFFVNDAKPLAAVEHILAFCSEWPGVADPDPFRISWSILAVTSTKSCKRWLAITYINYLSMFK